LIRERQVRTQAPGKPRRDGVRLLVDFLIGAWFVAVILTPQVVACILRGRLHRDGF
jgi:hypothetical protein